MNIIEKVQKACLFIILGKAATPSYSRNVNILNIETMFARHEKLCENFAKKSFKRPVHNKMFTWDSRRQTRAKGKVIVPLASTWRYDRSANPSLARIINSI